MRTRFRGITVREGVLLRGRPGGASGARSWSTTARGRRPWLRCAEEAAAGDWPAPVRDRGAGQRHGAGRRARAGARDRGRVAAARTAKVKVAEPGQALGRRRGPARGGARRARPGRAGPGRRQRRLGRRRGGRRDPAARPAAGGLEYVEQPCATVEELAARAPARVDVPIAADESIRRAEDPYRVRDLAGRRHRGAQGAAAGRRARPACGSPRRSGCPVVVSSRAGDLASASPPGSRWPRRCPSCRTPAGWPRCSCSPTTWWPSRCCRSTATLPVRRPGGRRRGAGDRLAAAPDRVALARRGWPPCAPCGRIGRRDPLAPASPARVVAGAGRAGRDRRRAGARLAQRAAAVRGARRRGRGLLRLHIRVDERDGRLPRAGPGEGVGGRVPGGVHVGHGGGQPAPGGARGRTTPACRWSWSPPTARPRCAAPAPTRPPTRSASSAPLAARPVDVAAPGATLGAALTVPRPGPPQRAARRAAAARRTRGSPTCRARPPGAAPARGRAGAVDARSRRPAHRRGRRRRRRPAGPGARPGRRLAAARRADQRLAHRRPRDPHLPAAARRRARAAGRAGRGLRAPDAVAPGSPAARPRRRARWSRHAAARALVGAAVPGRRAAGGRCRRPAAATTTSWFADWKAADRAARRSGSTRCWPPSPTSRRTRWRGRSARALPPGGLLVVGASNPVRDLDLMVPRVRRGRAAQGGRQPRPGRHRRHRLHRDRRRPGPPAGRPGPSR